jgi:dienelactone hydrolase
MESGMIIVREHNLVANFFPPITNKPSPAIIILGGSDGGIETATNLAPLFHAQGYAVLALAYFGIEPLPVILEEIPLEYFEQAVQWLQAQPDVLANRIGVLGISKGGEAALVLGSIITTLRVVVAIVPSHVVFQSVDFEWYKHQTARSSWMRAGQPLPFVPYQMDQQLIAQHGFMLGLYLGSLQNTNAVAQAQILVERTQGAILLISGQQDTLWPSEQMCNAITQRLEQNRFAFPVVHYAHDAAGHTLWNGSNDGGGTVEGNTKAYTDTWARVVAFLNANL